jgi:hypothetical protein
VQIIGGGGVRVRDPGTQVVLTWKPEEIDGLTCCMVPDAVTTLGEQQATQDASDEAAAVAQVQAEKDEAKAALDSRLWQAVSAALKLDLDAIRAAIDAQE